MTLTILELFDDQYVERAVLDRDTEISSRDSSSAIRTSRRNLGRSAARPRQPFGHRQTGDEASRLARERLRCGVPVTCSDRLGHDPSFARVPVSRDAIAQRCLEASDGSDTCGIDGSTLSRLSYADMRIVE